MTYLVLARKWRPRTFETLVGQDHVVRALTHALSTQRLHHAWLFTGTRGVGKTTLARILAKSLNCHAGITASPCGECAACTEIDAGRFVDYIELDAASNRGVDEMTQLLEQAVYSPSSGRFKVYTIDEVHMLTGHAFNAMLKTLEEPPPHVKFILATTDPQKIPATVLSRCLQFNLKQMTAESIISYLEMVLQQETIEYDIAALRLLARAAAGSMRDALSLTDQAISYSAGNLTAQAIQGMLGTIDQGHLTDLLRALGAGDASKVVSIADDLAMRGLSYTAALDDLAVLLSRVAIEQRIAGATAPEDPLQDDIKALAVALHPDVVQLFYSVAVHSRHELSLAPDEYAGFVMACLRMLALVPAGTVMAPSIPPQVAPAAMEGPAPDAKPVPDPISVSEKNRQAETTMPDAVPATPVAPAAAPAAASDSGVPPSSDIPPWEEIPASDQAHEFAASDAIAGSADTADDISALSDELLSDEFETLAVGPAVENALAGLAPVQKKTRVPRLKRMTAKDWPKLVTQLPLTGVAAELARQSEWLGVDGDSIRLRMAIRTLGETSARARLCTILSEHFGAVVELDIEYAETGDDTAHAIDQSHREKLQKQAERAVQDDPFVNSLISEFGGQLVSGSIRAGA